MRSRVLVANTRHSAAPPRALRRRLTATTSVISDHLQGPDSTSVRPTQTADDSPTRGHCLYTIAITHDDHRLKLPAADHDRDNL
jgi:hypothetical protein